MNYARFLKLTPIALAMLIALPALAQTDTEQSAADQEAGDIEEVIVTGSQIKGAAINDALAVSVISADDIEALGLSSGDELLDAMPEQAQPEPRGGRIVLAEGEVTGHAHAVVDDEGRKTAPGIPLGHHRHGGLLFVPL